MKKKITALALAAVMVLGLTACGGGAASSGTASTGAASSSTTDVAFVTDVGNIDDQSFNQYTWAGVQQFCDANGLNANYYKPSEDSDAARVEQMDNAVKDGAKVIVMAGYLFAPALEEAQAKAKDKALEEEMKARKPEDTLFSLDDSGRVLYVNTFTNTVSTAVRTAYLIVPQNLRKQFEDRIGFYTCTVPTFDQYILAELILNGDFERHINRVRRQKRKG